MRSVSVQEAKTQLSALLRAVEDGEEIEIRRGSVPIAMLVKTPERRSFADLEGIFADEGLLADPSVWEPDPRDARDFGLSDD